VATFLERRLHFLAIAEVVADTLAEFDGGEPRDLADVLEADAQARMLAERGAAVA